MVAVCNLRTGRCHRRRTCAVSTGKMNPCTEVSHNFKETLNQELPETIDDGINFGLKTSKSKVVDDETDSGDTNSVELIKRF